MELLIFELIVFYVLALVTGILIGRINAKPQKPSPSITVSDRTVHVIDNDGNYYTLDTYNGTWKQGRKLTR